MFESRGLRLVRETVGSKSAKLYRPCLKLTSIQSEVVPNKGYISQKITNRLHCKGSLDYSEENMLYSEENMLYSEENKLGEGSYRNVYHGDYEGMSVFVKQFKRNNCINSSLRQMFLRDLQTIRHNEFFLT